MNTVFYFKRHASSRVISNNKNIYTVCKQIYKNSVLSVVDVVVVYDNVKTFKQYSA